jgi:hypothetical protein
MFLVIYQLCRHATFVISYWRSGRFVAIINLLLKQVSALFLSPLPRPEWVFALTLIGVWELGGAAA